MGEVETTGSRREWRRRLASIQSAAAAGLVCAICWVWGLRALLAGPPVGASEQEIAAYLSSPAVGGVMVELQVLVVGTVGFLWFIGVIHTRLGRSESRLATTVNLGGSVLFAVFLLGGAAALAVPRVLVEVGGSPPEPGIAAATRAAAFVLVGFLAPRMATLVMMSSAQLGRQTGALPRWLVWVSVVVGLGEFLIATLWTPTVYVFPAWIALVSVVLLVRRPDESGEAASSG